MEDVNPGARVQMGRATDQLQSLIASYRAAGRDRLPREIELSAELGVSRNTLREALARLEADGVIARKRRVGTIILPEPTASSVIPAVTALEYPIDAIVSIPEFFTRADQRFEVLWVTVGQDVADESTAAVFGLHPGVEVYRVRRKYSIDDVPVAIGEHVIPKVLRGSRIHIDALTDGVSNFLSDVEHISVDVVEHVVSALSADAALARELAVAPGAAILDVSASLQTVEGGEVSVVALGRLLFNPRHITVSATGRAS